MTFEEWTKEGQRRFGPDVMAWRFVCPACKHEASVADWRAAGAPQDTVAFSCVGRWLPKARAAFGGPAADGQPGPCNYAGGGLFRIGPVFIEGRDGTYFDFAPEPVVVAPVETGQ